MQPLKLFALICDIPDVILKVARHPKRLREHAKAVAAAHPDLTRRKGDAWQIGGSRVRIVLIKDARQIRTLWDASTNKPRCEDYRCES